MIAAAYEHYLFFCETMKNAGLTNYVYELDFLQRPLSRMSKFQLMYYNKLKKYYQKAIRDIYDAAPYNGAVALMKGFAEDEDLYSEYFRTYNDIDLLIDEENIYPFIENLASLGYSFSDKPLNASNVQYDLSVSAHQAHIDPIFKKYGNITVCIEIHTVLKNTWKQLKEYNNMDLTKAVMQDVLPLDSGYYVLSPVDRFVFGLEHFGRHIISYYEQEWLHKKIFSVPLHYKSLFDAILIFYKYGLENKLEEIYDRISLLGFHYDISVANHILNTVFDFHFIDKNRLERCGNYAVNAQDAVSSQFITNLDAADIIKDGFCQKGIDFIKYSLSKSISAEFKNGKAELYIDNNRKSVTKDKYGSILRYPFLQARETHCSAHIQLSYDAQYLYFSISVMDDCLKISGPGVPNAWGESFNIFIYNPCYHYQNTHPITGLFVTPVFDENNILKVQMMYNNKWSDERGNQVIRLEDSCYEIKLENNGYKMNLKLKWELFEIDFHTLNYLGLDVILNDVDTDEPELDTVQCWSNISVQLHNPSRYGMLRF